MYHFVVSSNKGGKKWFSKYGYIYKTKYSRKD